MDNETFTSLLASETSESGMSFLQRTIRMPSLSRLDPSGYLTSSWLFTTLAIITGLLVLEQSIYRYKKGALPGPSWTFPVIGGFIDSMYPSIEKYKKQWALGPLSVASVFNLFIVIATSNEYVTKIFNSPKYANQFLVPCAREVLMRDNWIFLTGKAHAEYRKVLNILFTRKALGLYVGIQDAICRDHYAKWIEATNRDSKAKAIMLTARDLNMFTSLRVFCGGYIPEEAAKEINDQYWIISTALQLVNFPLAIPGTKMYNAIQAGKAAQKWLEHAAKCAKVSMTSGNEPHCMLDQWVREMQDPAYKGRKDFTDREMGLAVLSFLFASQDAMNSGLVYGFQHLADDPRILAKVREEQYRVRGGDIDKPITLEMLDKMPYLHMFVKESLRVKPPVTLVPYTSLKPWKISPDYTVPGNTYMAVSLYPSLHDPAVYPDDDKVVPERWEDPNGLANKNSRNYVVFGGGPHKCIGMEYAQMQMALSLANAAVLMDWDHEVTPESNEVAIISSIFPKDGCMMKFFSRSRP